MPTLPPTIINYDVSKALAALRQLEDRIRKGADEAKRKFDEAGQASKKFEDALGALSPRAAAALSTFKEYGGTFTRLGAQTGVIVGGLAAIGTQLVNVPEFFRDANEQLQNFNENLQRQVNLIERVGDISDARTLRGFEERSRSVRGRQAALAERQAALSEARDAIQEELKLHQEKYATLNAQARESVQVRRSLEDQMQGLLDRREDRQLSGLAPGRQFQELLARASQAREGGDFDRAEKFLEKAAQAAEAQGGHAFFTKQVAAEEDRLIASLQKEIGARKANDEARQRSIELEQKEIDKLKELDNQKRLAEREAGREQKLLRAESRTINLERRAFVDQDLAQTAGNFGQAELQNLNAAANAAVGGLQSFTDGLSTIKDRFLGGAGFTGISRQEQVVGGLERNVDIANRLVQQSGGDPKAIQDALAIVQGIIADANTLTQDPGFSEGFRRRIDLIKEFTDSFTRLATQAATSERAGVPLNQAVAQAPRIDFGESRTHGGGRQISGSGFTPLNVNVEVKGGMIDNQTVEGISDIILRKLRTLTGKPLSN